MAIYGFLLGANGSPVLSLSLGLEKEIDWLAKITELQPESAI